MKTVSAARGLAAARRCLAEPVGLVPTMGYLHEGHLALVRAAASECASVIVTIFVNPTQFGPSDDLASYPRNLDRDLSLLEAEGVDLVFHPPVEEMYPQGWGVTVDPGPIADRLEGAARPGHFRGVATIVTKLLNLAAPDAAYFGAKDAQQVVVIRTVARELYLPGRIVEVPTVREPDGLALSSRNVYLDAEQRAAAPALYRGLTAAKRLWQTGELEAAVLRCAVQQEVEGESAVRVEYVSVADTESLEELTVVPHAGALVSLAARLGKARLIDNIRLEPASRGSDE